MRYWARANPNKALSQAYASDYTASCWDDIARGKSESTDSAGKKRQRGGRR